MIPATLVATPLGQLTSEHIDKTTVQGVGGVLVTLIALFELCRSSIWAPILGLVRKQAERPPPPLFLQRSHPPCTLTPCVLSSPVLERLLCLRTPIRSHPLPLHTHIMLRARPHVAARSTLYPRASAPRAAWQHRTP